MVKRDSTRKHGVPRQTEKDSELPAGSDPAGTETALVFYERAMQAGHGQLIKAKVMLECMAFTLAYHREATEREIQLEASDFALMVEIARDFLRNAMDRLDSASLMRAMNAEAVC